VTREKGYITLINLHNWRSVYSRKYKLVRKYNKKIFDFLRGQYSPPSSHSTLFFFSPPSTIALNSYLYLSLFFFSLGVSNFFVCPFFILAYGFVTIPSFGESPYPQGGKRRKPASTLLQ